MNKVWDFYPIVMKFTVHDIGPYLPFIQDIPTKQLHDHVEETLRFQTQWIW